MNNRITTALVFLSLSALFGCTEPGETTQIGAATGGVVGASLGAMIGNQTGDTGSGLVVGALAGAATGAAVGNTLEAQSEIVRTQDEAIERQERQVQAQRAEIEELRRASNDSVSYRGRGTAENSIARRGFNTYKQNLDRGQNYNANSPRAAIRETDLGTAITSPAQPQQLSGRDQIARELSQTEPARVTDPINPRPVENRLSEAMNKPTLSASALSTSTAATPDCVKALSEARTAEQATENADKLFRFRRALRLCPSEPSFHNGLGEVYMALNRKVDAEFEFKEALSLDAGYKQAQDNLRTLKGNS